MVFYEFIEVLLGDRSTERLKGKKKVKAAPNDVLIVTPTCVTFDTHMRCPSPGLVKPNFFETFSTTCTVSSSQTEEITLSEEEEEDHLDDGLSTIEVSLAKSGLLETSSAQKEKFKVDVWLVKKDCLEDDKFSTDCAKSSPPTEEQALLEEDEDEDDDEDDDDDGDNGVFKTKVQAGWQRELEPSEWQIGEPTPPPESEPKSLENDRKDLDEQLESMGVELIEEARHQVTASWQGASVDGQIREKMLWQGKTTTRNPVEKCIQNLQKRFEVVRNEVERRRQKHFEQEKKIKQEQMQLIFEKHKLNASPETYPTKLKKQESSPSSARSKQGRRFKRSMEGSRGKTKLQPPGHKNSRFHSSSIELSKMKLLGSKEVLAESASSVSLHPKQERRVCLSFAA